MSTATWKQQLKDSMPADWAEEIDVFERQLDLRKAGKIEDKLFAETRLRRGVYGQRYDNGQRHDGERSQSIPYPCGELTKGPETAWDAPGMQRIKLTFGGMSNEQLDVLSDLAEEYSDSILHITTRQDIQLHFVHIEDTPDLMRRLAAVGVTTREACGNSVRNVTACPYAGVCNDEGFDVTPYARAIANYLLGHPDTQDFGRKFKIAVSGCHQHACALTAIHDIGATAETRLVDGEPARGFRLVVGGGLGAVPHQAQVFAEFVPEEQLLPICQAICRVFAALGEKNNRARARLKFLIKKLGIDEFRRLCLAERERIPPDERWTTFIADRTPGDRPLKPPSTLVRKAGADAGFEEWFQTNVRPQAQSGYSVVTIRLPLGDLTSDQGRALADLARETIGDSLRTTVEQNVVMRWVSNADIPMVYRRLRELGLGHAGAGTVVDVTSCPGTDTCKLGISASRGLAAELSQRLAVGNASRDKAVKDLRIKVSGCFNSCGQHHVADLGFLGVSRNVNGRRVPHFQVVLGGQWTQNGGAYGLAVGAVPSKRIPAVVERLTEHYAHERTGDESFQDYVKRVGKRRMRDMLADLIQVPAYDADSSLYHDWGDPREYTIGDMGQGECAGEIVSVSKFGLSDSERELFDAQDALEAGDARTAAQGAYRAMLSAAKALIRAQTFDISSDPEHIVGEFRTRFYDTKLFWDQYAGGKFAHYLFRLHDADLSDPGAEDAHHAVEEAQLFIDHAYRCEANLQPTVSLLGVSP